MTTKSLSPGLIRTDAALREAGWWLLVVVACVATARLTLIEPQWGCTLALLVLTGGLYVRSRTAGLVAVWAIWLLAPGLRRVFGVLSGFSDADPLALAPFLATALVAVLELRRADLSRGAVVGAVAAAMRRAWRGARASPRGTDLLVFAMLVFILVACWAGDLLYGVTGIAFWYLLGVAWRRDDVRARLRTERLTA